MRTIVLAFAGLLVSLAIAWAVLRPGNESDRRDEIHVSAAASLADAMTALGRRYQRNHHHAPRVQFNFASSGMLSKKIQAGADVDVFISASSRHVDALADSGSLDRGAGARRDLLSNTLVCVVSASSDIRLGRVGDLAGPGIDRIAIGDPAHTPAGAYTAQSLRTLGLWDRLAGAGRLSYCPNVRAALAQVRTGAVKAAVVYRTDALSTRDVRVELELPADSHEKVVYPACVPARSPRIREARAFVAFLASEEGRRVFAKHGFTPLGSPAAAPLEPADQVRSKRPTPMWNEASTEALRLSVLVSAVTAVVLVLVGTPMAFWLSRCRGVFPRLVESILSLPLVVPPVVTGYGLLLLLSPAGPLGGFLERVGVRIAFDWKGAVLAAFAMALPIFLAVAKTAFQRCDPALEAAARTLNAGRIRAFATVTLPLAAPGLLAAAAVSFARAFGEFGATIMLAGNIPGHTQTVSQGVYTDLMAGRDNAAWGLVLVSVGVGITAMVASQLLIARARPGSGGEVASDA